MKRPKNEREELANRFRELFSKFLDSEAIEEVIAHSEAMNDATVEYKEPEKDSVLIIPFSKYEVN